MDPKFISDDEEKVVPSRRLRLRELAQILALVHPYRKKLAVGLAATVLFAALHTLSIAGVFPVFKILLEEEGIAGWVDRTVAGERLGVEFAHPVDDTSVAVLRVPSSDVAPARRLVVLDSVSDPQGRPVAALLHDLACAPEGEPVTVTIDGKDRPTTLEVTPGELTWQHILMQRGAGVVGAETEGDRAKLRVLASILGFLVVVILAANVFRYVGEILIATAVLRTMMDVRAKLYERTLHLPMVFFSGRSTADVVTRFVQDIQEMQRGLMTFFGKCIREPLRAALILGLALWLDWRITIVMAVVAPLTLGVFLAVGRSVKKANKRLLQGYGRMIGALTASLQNLAVVKAYTAEVPERIRLTAVDRDMFRQQLKLAKLQAFVSPMIETLAVFAASLVTVWLAGRVLSHDLSISKFLELGVVLSMLFDPLRKLTDVYVRVQRSTAGAERVFQVLDEPIESDDDPSRVTLAPLKEGIELTGVNFAYPGAATPALCDINLTIKRGETLALVGPNGCGKTTLVSLLPRLIVPDSGEIRYDGTPFAQANLRSLRRQIGVVSQEAIVFAGTPVENIAYGQKDVDRERVESASRRAFADEFIREIPGGYDATLGERGTTLSGGQRQRLAIARAIYRDAPILIFDEATSQIDSESERKIQDALKEFARGRTTLIVAHRLSTIQFADRIIVMDAGRIIDSGSHKELYKQCALYRTLCDTQLLGDLSGA